jgi:hypothetical protein
MLVGPYAAIALVLGIGGVMKARDPSSTAGALRALGLPGRPTAVRVAAAAEVAIAAYALLIGGRAAAALVSLSYAAFTLFVALALSRDAMVGSCGCFGKLDTPPSTVHLVVNAAAAVLAGLLAVDGGRRAGALVVELQRQSLGGVPFVALVASCAGLVILAFTLLPQALGLVRR